METTNLSTAELERHLLWHKQTLAHLVRDFGAEGERSQMYRETQGRVEYLESVIEERSE
jgi:hypothetical protein